MKKDRDDDPSADGNDDDVTVAVAKKPQVVGFDFDDYNTIISKLTTFTQISQVERPPKPKHGIQTLSMG